MLCNNISLIVVVKDIIMMLANDYSRTRGWIVHSFIFSLLLSISSFSYATNGMDMEGYGPIATSMGGASYAYDNGTAAMMNNVATLGLVNDGESRFNLALGFLGPTIEVKHAGSGSQIRSRANAFYMPAIGYATRKGDFTYGVGMFSQGGMGAEYDSDSFLSIGTDEKALSQVGVGRLLFPLAYNVNDSLVIGGSLDYVWGMMDIRMPMAGSDLMSFASGTSVFGAASGSLLTGLNNLMNPPAGPAVISGVNNAVIEFADGSDFSGEAFGDGFAGKVGLVYSVNDKLSIGISYHNQTHLSDLIANNASLSMSADIDIGLAGGGAPTGYVTTNIPLTGKITVKDFQWPSTFGVGFKYLATKEWMIVADIKKICWADVMKDFKMTFVADSTQRGIAAGFASAEMDMTMYQNWDDQYVLSLGAEYKYSPALKLRGGINVANNPVPDEFLNPLFPAIVKNHLTFGGGYKIAPSHWLDISLTYAMKASQTNNNSGISVSSHRQFNVQAMYCYRF